MADRREAEKLWAEILACEKLPSGNPQDFEYKRKEMERLRLAYQRASGTSSHPHNWRENEVKGDLQAFGEITGGQAPITSDDLNNKPKGYVPYKERT